MYIYFIYITHLFIWSFKCVYLAVVIATATATATHRREAKKIAESNRSYCAYNWKFCVPMEDTSQCVCFSFSFFWLLLLFVLYMYRRKRAAVLCGAMTAVLYIYMAIWIIEGHFAIIKICPTRTKHDQCENTTGRGKTRKKERKKNKQINKQTFLLYHFTWKIVLIESVDKVMKSL